MNIKEMATQHLPDGYGLPVEELAEFLMDAKADPPNTLPLAILAAYNYGFQRGTRRHTTTEDREQDTFSQNAEAALKRALNGAAVYQISYNATESGSAVTIQAATSTGPVDVYMYDEDGKHSIEIYGPDYADKMEQNESTAGQTRDSMEPYTLEAWKRSGTFAAVPGQEITLDVYEEMRGTVPPKPIDRQDLERWNAGSGFCMGKPYTTGPNGQPLFLAFIRKEGKAYFIGLAHTSQDEE